MKFRIKTAAVFLIFSLLFAVFLLPSFEGAEQYSVTDAKSGKVFAVTDNDGEITINSDNNTFQFFIDCKTAGVCCFDSVFTFLCTAETTQNNYIYTIYTYNKDTGALDSFATNCKAPRNNHVFTADGKGKLYILNPKDSTLIHCFENGQEANDINSYSPVAQMICVDTEKVLLFSVDGVYLLKNGYSKKISSLVPVYPCVYSGDGIVTDRTGNMYIFDADSFEVYNEETKPANTPSPNKGNIDFDLKNKIITASAGTTVTDILDYFGINSGDVIFRKADGSIITSGKLSTGMRVIAQETAYSVIVIGDLTGEGNVNTRDLDTLMKHLTEETLLKGEFAKAADLNKDNRITTKDLLKLSKLY